MTSITTGSGRAVSLLRPRACDVDFDVDIAEGLARVPRFNGQVRSGSYSVAQHCVLGAHLIFRQHANAAMAAAFLLHDAHEAYMGDIATPVAEALAEYVRHGHAETQRVPEVKIQIAAMKGRLDAAIHEAAELPWPLPGFAAKVAKDMDLAIGHAEWLQLMPGPVPHPFNTVPPARLNGRITVWPWPKAADEYRAALAQYCPAALNAPRPRGRTVKTLEKRTLAR